MPCSRAEGFERNVERKTKRRLDGKEEEQQKVENGCDKERKTDDGRKKREKEGERRWGKFLFG